MDTKVILAVSYKNIGSFWSLHNFTQIQSHGFIYNILPSLTHWDKTLIVADVNCHVVLFYIAHLSVVCN